jgi:two-component system sensor histidine kinase KdpD
VKNWRSPFAGIGVTLAAAIILTVMLVPFREDVGLVNHGLLFLLLTLLISSFWGRDIGILAAIVTNLFLNFFFIKPYYTPTVEEPRNILALVVFLLVSLIGGSLLSAARRASRESRRREAETQVLLNLSRGMAGRTDPSEALDELCLHVVTAFQAPGAAVLLREKGTWSLLAHAGSDAAARPLEPAERAAADRAVAEGSIQAVGETGLRRQPVRVVYPAGRQGAIASARSLAFAPLRVGDRTLGVLRLDGPIGHSAFREQPQELLNAVANEAALALQRAELSQAAAHAEALREADELKSALLNAVSHDLRTPLASIIASAESLLQTDVTWSEKEKEEFAGAIHTQAERLDRLVGNLLDLSRIESGSLRPDKGWYDVGSLLAEVVGRLKSLASAHRITLDVQEDLPPVSLDYIEIDAVLTNLIENAVKYTPPGSSISVAAHEDNGQLLIEVADDGAGLPPDALGRIFEPFFRVEGARAKGTGMGLAVARGLIEAHGGRIWAENRPEGGARFAFTLPLADPERQEDRDTTRTSR